MPSSLGVTIELSSEVAAQLRGKSEWDDVIPLPTRAESRDADASHEEAASVVTGPVDFPQIRIDLKRLLGYVPSSNAVDTIEAALLQTLDEQIDELFASGIAFHTTYSCTCIQSLSRVIENDHCSKVISDNDSCAKLGSSSNNIHDDDDESKDVAQSSEYLVINYPYPVDHIWQRLCQTHDIAVVDRVRKHLIQCHRTLEWKDALYHEIMELVDTEKARHMQEDLKRWKEQRSAQLDKLYSIRETLMHRLETLQQSRYEMEETRDQLVKRDLTLMIQNPEQGETQALLNSLDLLTKDDIAGVFGVDSESERDELDDEYRVISDDDDDIQGMDDPDGSYGCGDKADGDAEVSIRNNGTAQDRNSPNNTLAIQRQLWNNQAKEDEQQKHLEDIRRKREQLEEKYTGPELRKLQAVVAGLEDRIEKVDDLLESIQDEEWRDEEETENESQVGSSPTNGNYIQSSDNETGRSLLDQILAMIFTASTPPSTTLDKNEKIWYVKEHISIVSEWKAEFGRLPMALALDGSRVTTVDADSVSLSVEDRRKKSTHHDEVKGSLGIFDNEKDDWEELVDDDGDQEKTIIASTCISLRPSGRV